MTRITFLGEPDPEAPRRPAPAFGDGSADRAVVSFAVELPWDEYLGAGAGDRVRDGSLGLVRHAYPPAAARDILAAATVTGMLAGDAALRERVGAVALGIAALHHRPARMPHLPGDEPNAWWVAEERTLYWLPWAGESAEPYGLRLITDGGADAVVVLGPDASWTVFATGVPHRGAAGGWDDLPGRMRVAVRSRVSEPSGLERARWRREGDTVTVRWPEGPRVRTVRIVVNRGGAFG